MAFRIRGDIDCFGHEQCHARTKRKQAGHRPRSSLILTFVRAKKVIHLTLAPPFSLLMKPQFMFPGRFPARRTMDDGRWTIDGLSRLEQRFPLCALRLGRPEKYINRPTISAIRQSSSTPPTFFPFVCRYPLAALLRHSVLLLLLCPAL